MFGVLRLENRTQLDLETRFANLLRRATALRGTIYRSVAPKYANSLDLLSGEGSRRNGARWNPIGVATVYGSFTPQTALEETLAHANYYGLPIHASDAPHDNPAISRPQHQATRHQTQLKTPGDPQRKGSPGLERASGLGRLEAHGPRRDRACARPRIVQVFMPVSAALGRGY
jgi:hypothetical protein